MELPEGEVFNVSAIGPSHASCLLRSLVGTLSDDDSPCPSNPFELDDRSNPQPDLAVPKLKTDGYKTDGSKVAHHTSDDYGATEHCHPGDLVTVAAPRFVDIPAATLSGLRHRTRGATAP